MVSGWPKRQKDLNRGCIMSDSNDSLEVLERLIPQLPQARLAEQFGEALHEAGIRTRALLPSIERLELWEASIDLLVGKWEADEERHTVESLERLRKAGEEIRSVQDREQLTRVPTVVSNAETRIATVLRDGMRAWQRRIDVDLGSLGSLSTLLVQFPDTREVGSRMASVASRAATLKNQFPPASAQREQHRQILEEIELLKRDLAAIGAGESVQNFLLALASGTATLDMLDDAVLGWIRNRRAETRFRISFGGSIGR